MPSYNVRLTKPLMREALLIMLSMCLFQESELLMVIPKSHTVFTLFRSIVEYNGIHRSIKRYYIAF